MIGYVTIGANDFEAAKSFYDKALAGLGASRGFKNDRMQFYSTKGGATALAVCKPYDGSKATAGNGTMVSLVAPSREVVDQVYKDAIAAGAKDEGAPGERTAAFYGAYFRDPDGNKICIFKMG